MADHEVAGELEAHSNLPQDLTHGTPGNVYSVRVLARRARETVEHVQHRARAMAACSLRLSPGHWAVGAGSSPTWRRQRPPSSGLASALRLWPRRPSGAERILAPLLGSVKGRLAVTPARS
jgi:hypothetical protein